MRTINNRKKFANRQSQDKERESVMAGSLYKELEQYQKAGVSLWLNGKPSSSLKIASCIREESDFMRDYHINQENVVCGLGFDRIRKKHFMTEHQTP